MRLMMGIISDAVYAVAITCGLYAGTAIIIAVKLQTGW